jgi:hypothetical protein
MSKGRVRYVWVPVALALVATVLGLAYVHWSKSGPGAGLYSQVWSPDPVQGWWDPGRFFTPSRGFSLELDLPYVRRLSKTVVEIRSARLYFAPDWCQSTNPVSNNLMAHG